MQERMKRQVKEQMTPWIGKPVVLYTAEGAQVGMLEAVTDEGVRLSALPKQEREGLDVEQVFFGGGLYPWGGLGGFGGLGLGFGGLGGFGGGFGPGFGFGPRYGFGPGLGYGFRRPFFW
ncbi:MAG TPA: hypothetical protein VFV52_00950 [Bacilli bacterium]|nr:hypothetical protein [Bacilli bacterium]